MTGRAKKDMVISGSASVAAQEVRRLRQSRYLVAHYLQRLIRHQSGDRQGASGSYFPVRHDYLAPSHVSDGRHGRAHLVVSGANDDDVV